MPELDYPWSDERDISEDEAREVLCKALGCKPHDITIAQHWTVITPNPGGGHENAYLRRDAPTLRAAAWKVVVDHGEAKP